MMSNDSRAWLIAKLQQSSAEGTANFKATFGVSPRRWLQMEAEHGTSVAYGVLSDATGPA